MADVAIYIRLSEEDRYKNDKEQDSESIKNQRSMLSEYAIERGWDIYEIYSDEDYSGSDASRPAFNKMIRDAREGKFQVVLCKSLSRFARDVAMVETYINGLFIEWGIRFVSLSDYADSSQKGNRKNIQINSLVNQWYLEDLSENVKSVMRHKKKQGQFVGSFAPYGYVKSSEDSHKLIIDGDAADVVKRIYQMYLDGYGNKAIANQLNDEKIPCPSKYRLLKGIQKNRSDDAADELRWSDHTIWHITRNPNYTGDLVQCRYGKPTYKSKSVKEKTPSEWITVENTHEAIISKDDYNRVQSMKKTRGMYHRQHTENTSGALVQNIFSGSVKCKICGRSLITSGSGKLNNNTRYLRCTGRKSGVSGCNCAMVKYDTLNMIITERIREIISEFCDFNAFEKRVQKKDNRFTSEIETLKKNIEKNIQEQKKIDKALSDSYIDKSTGIISAEEFSVISKGLNLKKSDFIKNYDTMQERIIDLQKSQEAESRTNYIINKYSDFKELNREIIEAFIETIYIGERDIETNDFLLEIVWKI